MQWEDHTDRRSPLLLVYGLAAGGAMIGLVLLISFLQQNVGSLFTAGAAQVVLVTTAVGVAVAWFAGRRSPTHIGRVRRPSRPRRSSRSRLGKKGGNVLGSRSRRQTVSLGGRRLVGNGWIEQYVPRAR